MSKKDLLPEVTVLSAAIPALAGEEGDTVAVGVSARDQPDGSAHFMVAALRAAFDHARTPPVRRTKDVPLCLAPEWNQTVQFDYTITLTTATAPATGKSRGRRGPATPVLGVNSRPEGQRVMLSVVVFTPAGTIGAALVPDCVPGSEFSSSFPLVTRTGAPVLNGSGEQSSVTLRVKYPRFPGRFGPALGLEMREHPEVHLGGRDAPMDPAPAPAPPLQLLTPQHPHPEQPSPDHPEQPHGVQPSSSTAGKGRGADVAMQEEDDGAHPGGDGAKEASRGGAETHPARDRDAPRGEEGGAAAQAEQGTPEKKHKGTFLGGLNRLFHRGRAEAGKGAAPHDHATGGPVGNTASPPSSRTGGGRDAGGGAEPVRGAAEEGEGGGANISRDDGGVNRSASPVRGRQDASPEPEGGGANSFGLHLRGFSSALHSNKMARLRHDHHLPGRGSREPSVESAPADDGGAAAREVSPSKTGAVAPAATGYFSYQGETQGRSEARGGEAAWEDGRATGGGAAITSERGRGGARAGKDDAGRSDAAGGTGLEDAPARERDVAVTIRATDGAGKPAPGTESKRGGVQPVPGTDLESVAEMGGGRAVESKENRGVEQASEVSPKRQSAGKRFLSALTSPFHRAKGNQKGGDSHPPMDGGDVLSMQNAEDVDFALPNAREVEEGGQARAGGAGEASGARVGPSPAAGSAGASGNFRAPGNSDAPDTSGDAARGGATSRARAAPSVPQRDVSAVGLTKAPSLRSSGSISLTPSFVSPPPASPTQHQRPGESPAAPPPPLCCPPPRAPVLHSGHARVPAACGKGQRLGD